METRGVSFACFVQMPRVVGQCREACDVIAAAVATVVEIAD